MIEPTEVGAASVVFEYEYAICTLVTSFDEYHEMVSSFEAAGFSADRCQYLYVDNQQGNVLDAYRAINHFLVVARARYLIYCHQDILLAAGDREKLSAIIADRNVVAPNWAVLSNAGVDASFKVAARVRYPDGEYFCHGSPPVAVKAIDEHFFVVDRQTRVGVSSDLDGFHFYGTDIATLSWIMGYSVWVVDFPVLHKSRGVLSAKFLAGRDTFREKYAWWLRFQYFRTNTGELMLTRSRLLMRLTRVGLFRNLFRALGKRREPGRPE